VGRGCVVPAAWREVVASSENGWAASCGLVARREPPGSERRRYSALCRRHNSAAVRCVRGCELRARMRAACANAAEIRCSCNRSIPAADYERQCQAGVWERTARGCRSRHRRLALVAKAADTDTRVLMYKCNNNYALGCGVTLARRSNGHKIWVSQIIATLPAAT
jgi:hypothetical protein